jgi:hypothetical protein
LQQGRAQVSLSFNRVCDTCLASESITFYHPVYYDRIWLLLLLGCAQPAKHILSGLLMFNSWVGSCQAGFSDSDITCREAWCTSITSRLHRVLGPYFFGTDTLVSAGDLAVSKSLCGHKSTDCRHTRAKDKRQRLGMNDCDPRPVC